MNQVITALGTLLLTVALGGCGQGEDGTSPTSNESAEPKAVDMIVTLRDAAPHEVLFNGDDSSCTTFDFAEILDLALANPEASADDLKDLAPKVSVGIKTADGTIVGTKELPRDGGDYDKASGCTWSLNFFGLEASEFYEVTVMRADFIKTETVQVDPDSEKATEIGITL